MVKGYLKSRFKFLKNDKNHVGYIESGIRNQYRCDKQLQEYTNWNTETFLRDFYKKYNLKLSKVELIDFNEPLTHTKLIVKQEKESPESFITKIRLYKSKEINHISDKAFQSLTNAGVHQNPSLRDCKNWKRIMNSEFKIKSNTMGSYVSPKEKLKYYIRKFKTDLRIRNNHVNIRLAGDGTQVGSNLSVLNFTFGFLDKINEKTNPNTVTGNFSLGTFWIRTESYDDIKIALKEICDELKDLESIEIDEQKFKLEFYLGGDLKFIALVLGNF